MRWPGRFISQCSSRHQSTPGASLRRNRISTEWKKYFTGSIILSPGHEGNQRDGELGLINRSDSVTMAQVDGVISTSG